MSTQALDSRLRGNDKERGAGMTLLRYLAYRQAGNYAGQGKGKGVGMISNSLEI
jgi:hypothetical protein